MSNYDPELKELRIPPEELFFLFERFFRSYNVSDTPGTGLGLAIANELVLVYPDKINVRSELGKKATISIFLPRFTEVPLQETETNPTSKNTMR